MHDVDRQSKVSQMIADDMKKMLGRKITYVGHSMASEKSFNVGAIKIGLDDGSILCITMQIDGKEGIIFDYFERE